MTQTNVTTLVDAYGELKAKLAELEEQERQLKRELADWEPGAYEGEAYRLTISLSDRVGQDKVFRERVEALIEEHLSRQFIKAHTTLTPVRAHRVVARNGKGTAG
jgi:uncharacterized protein YhaN